MLCLNRKIGEKIFLRTATGDEICVRVLTIESQRVKLGFDAPLSVTIAREEVRDEPKYNA